MGTFRKLQVFTATGIAMDSLATALLGTVPAGKTFVLTSVQITITTPPSAFANFAVSVGTNASLYNNLSGARFVDLNMRNDDDRLALMEPFSSAQPVAENTDIRLRVAAATTGPGVMEVKLVGFLF